MDIKTNDKKTREKHIPKEQGYEKLKRRVKHITKEQGL